jgi:hypothetical protein
LFLISGIAWDHINVFPTYENYKSIWDFIERLLMVAFLYTTNMIVK